MRLAFRTAPGTLGRTWGIARSMAIYHGYHALPPRRGRMARLYGQFLRRGDLAFDIGAHVGGRVRAWRRLGARVVAVEPQPDCLRVLRRLYGRSRDVRIVPLAVGAEPGVARLAVSTTNPTVSSMSDEWMARVAGQAGFAAVRWDATVEVEVVTLDDLIAAHGEPAFCKVDVEGFEVQVLAGLSRPVPGLSFEYLPSAHDKALAALQLVEKLGEYRYNYSPVESMRLASERWMDAAQLVTMLEQRVRPTGLSGDIYARRPPAGHRDARQPS